MKSGVYSLTMSKNEISFYVSPQQHVTAYLFQFVSLRYEAKECSSEWQQGFQFLTFERASALSTDLSKRV